MFRRRGILPDEDANHRKGHPGTKHLDFEKAFARDVQMGRRNV